MPKFWAFFTAPIPCYSVRDSRLKNFLIKKRYSKRLPLFQYLFKKVIKKTLSKLRYQITLKVNFVFYNGEEKTIQFVRKHSMNKNVNSNQRRPRAFKFIGDRQNATYRCEIYLRPEHCYSNVNGDGAVMFDGYSKHKFHDEPKDKERCLSNFVQRIVANGYLEKSYYISFCTNKNIGKSQDELLIEFNPLQSEKFIVTHGAVQTYFILADYLKNLKEIKLSTPEFKELKPNYPANNRASELELFRMYKNRFATKEDLVEHCKNLKVKKFPQGRIEGFYYAYLAAFPFS